MDWSPKLKMGDLKPLIKGWIQTAMTNLAGADMKPSLVKAFKNDGHFKLSYAIHCTFSPGGSQLVDII
jgi:hypothetical protein